MVTLISDGGTMTVGRRTASYTWGSFDVVLPDGTEQQEDDGRLIDGYIYRPDDRGRGRGELTFVRADARIDMNAEKSDLEDTLDGASRRTEGGIFYTREISGLGLGKKIPGVDYSRGDLVDVLVWGKRITLPVTGLRRIASTDRGRYDAVQVGGQALADPDRQRKLNSDLDRQIAAEKRQRLKEAGEIRDTADAAKSTAETAQGTADGVEQDLHSTHVEPVEESWYPTELGWRGAVETLNRNFANQRDFQSDVNADLQARIQAHEDMLRDLQQAKSRALATTFRMVVGESGVTTDPTGHIRLTISQRELIVEALGTWSGDIILDAVRGREDTGDYATGEIPSAFQAMWAVPHPEHVRRRVFTIPVIGKYTTWISAKVTAQIRPGTMVESARAITGFEVDRLGWRTAARVSTTRTGEHTILAAVGWHAATYDNSYGMRLVIGGDVVAIEGPRTRVGPLTTFGKGYVRWVLDVRDRVIAAGTDIEVQVWTSATGRDQRTVRDGELRVWWIEQ